MLVFERKVLKNGLHVVLHHDPTNPLASVDLHYKVGSRDDHKSQTGMAHLFEHLMFAGTKKFPSYDKVIQNAGGENNAFTTNDSTNYHITLPSVNIELALMVESDRMRNLKISNKVFEREKNVVLEEFKETCLNKPYGDSFHLICKLAYKHHPYRWPLIGMNARSISKLKLSEALRFYKTYYQPSNAILSINSNVDNASLFKLIEKHFGSIPSAKVVKKSYPIETGHTSLQKTIARKKAPAEAIYMAFNMADRLHKDFYVADVISDILSNGHSTRLLKNLLRGKKMVSTIDAYITASLDPGLFIIEAKLIPGKSMKELEKYIWKELELLKKVVLKKRELTKIKNTIESSLVFSEINGLNRAITLGFFEMLGDAHRANEEGKIYQSLTPADVQATARRIFQRKNCSIVYYKRSADGQGFFEEDEDED